jgi:hypothetical protein
MRPAHDDEFDSWATSRDAAPPPWEALNAAAFAGDWPLTVAAVVSQRLGRLVAF